MASSRGRKVLIGGVLGLVVAMAAVAYAQSVEGPTGELGIPHSVSSEPRDLEELALALKTRARLLQRQENTGEAADLAEAARRLDERLTQLQLLRDEIGVQIAAIHTQRQELAQKYTEVETMRKQLLADLDQKRSTLIAELDAKRTELLGEAQTKNEGDVTGLVEMVDSMRGPDAAALLAQVEQSLAVKVLERMSRIKAGKALAAMDPTVAARLAEKMVVKPTFENLGLAQPDAMLDGSGQPPDSLSQPTTLGDAGSGVGGAAVGQPVSDGTAPAAVAAPGATAGTPTAPPAAPVTAAAPSTGTPVPAAAGTPTAPPAAPVAAANPSDKPSPGGQP